jgi:hypothetical protein
VVLDAPDGGARGVAKLFSHCFGIERRWEEGGTVGRVISSI